MAQLKPSENTHLATFTHPHTHTHYPVYPLTKTGDLWGWTDCTVQYIEWDGWLSQGFVSLIEVLLLSSFHLLPLSLLSPLLFTPLSRPDSQAGCTCLGVRCFSHKHTCAYMIQRRMRAPKLTHTWQLVLIWDDTWVLGTQKPELARLRSQTIRPARLVNILQKVGKIEAYTIPQLIYIHYSVGCSHSRY